MLMIVLLWSKNGHNFNHILITSWNLILTFNQGPLTIWTSHSFFCIYNQGPLVNFEYFQSGLRYQCASFTGWKFRIFKCWKSPKTTQLCRLAVTKPQPKFDLKVPMEKGFPYLSFDTLWRKISQFILATLTTFTTRGQREDEKIGCDMSLSSEVPS